MKAKVTTIAAANSNRPISWNSLLHVGAMVMTPMIIIVNRAINTTPSEFRFILILISFILMYVCDYFVSYIAKVLQLGFLASTCIMFQYILQLRPIEACNIAECYFAFRTLAYKSVWSNCTYPCMLVYKY